MEILGGRAGYDFVSFTGERHQSISRFKDGKITTEVRLKKENKKIIVVISKIPFVRSFSMFLELIIEYWRRFLFAIIVLLLMEYLFIRTSNSYLSHTVPISTLEMFFGALFIAGLIIKITPIGKYHSSEHQVANAYLKDPNLTLEKVKKQSRTHKDCGTNLAVSVVICFFILSMIFGDASWVFLVSWILGFELWRNEPKGIWKLVLVFGKVTQYMLFTSKPKEKHLMVAIEALTKLEEKELANN